MSLPVRKVAIPALATAAYTPKQTMTKKNSSSKMESIKERLTITTTKHMSVSAKRFTDSIFPPLFSFIVKSLVLILCLCT